MCQAMRNIESMEQVETEVTDVKEAEVVALKRVTKAWTQHKAEVQMFGNGRKDILNTNRNGPFFFRNGYN